MDDGDAIGLFHRMSPIVQMQRPPSTSIATPVIMLASSEHRNAAALAMSAGVENRPIGIVERNLARELRRVRAHEGLEQGRIAGDGIDRIDADAERRKFDRHRAGRGDRPALRGVVPGQVRPRAHAAGRGDIEDDAVFLAP